MPRSRRRRRRAWRRSSASWRRIAHDRPAVFHSLVAATRSCSVEITRSGAAQAKHAEETAQLKAQIKAMAMQVGAGLPGAGAPVGFDDLLTPRVTSRVSRTVRLQPLESSHPSRTRRTTHSRHYMLTTL